MKTLRFVLAALLVSVLLAGASVMAAEQAPWMAAADKALNQAFSKIGSDRGDAGLLLLTNAGYGQAAGQSTETFIDLASKITGCSTGARNLLAVHASVLDPLWFSLYRKDTGQLVFAKWTGSGFEEQALDASPEKILTPEGWKQAAAGPLGSKVFSVVSISLTWAVDPPWTLLLSAAFHDHFCPGVNSGYLAGQYVMDKLPLGSGDQYVFVTAPAKCAADALQVMFNTTPGKSGGFSMSIDGKKLQEYASGGVAPMTVAMRVNRKKDECNGLVLGFDWRQAYKATGVGADEMAPKGGPGNPMFWVARAKMSRELAAMPPEKLLGMIVELKSFSGPAKLADQISGGDPYAVAWNE